MLIKNFKLSGLKNQRGDTIVEVLVSITILAVVLTVAFISTSNSLHQGTNANNRQEASSYAQQQVELIKNALNGTTAPAFQQPAGQFCAVPTSSQPQTGATCSQSFGQYTLNDTYNGGLYTITANWTASDKPQSLIVYYRIPNPGTYASTSLSFSANPTSEPVGGGAATLNWNVTNATSCLASSSPADANWNGNLSSAQITDGSHSLSINVSVTTTYTLVCNNGGTPADGVATISVALPPPPPPPPVNPPAVFANDTNWIGNTESQMQFVATVNPENNTEGATCTFYYGQNDAVDGNGKPLYEAGVPCDQGASLPAGTSGVRVTVTVPVPDDNNYYWFICATNSAGIACAEGPGYQQGVTSGGGGGDPGSISINATDNGGTVNWDAEVVGATDGNFITYCQFNNGPGLSGSADGTANATGSDSDGDSAQFPAGPPQSIICFGNSGNSNQTDINVPVGGGCGSSCPSGPAWVSFGVTYYGDIQSKSTSNGAQRPGWCNDNVHSMLLCAVFVTSGEGAIGGGCTVSWEDNTSPAFIQQQYSGNTADSGLGGNGIVLGWPNSFTSSIGQGPLQVACTNLPTKTWFAPDRPDNPNSSWFHNT